MSRARRDAVIHVEFTKCLNGRQTPIFGFMTKRAPPQNLRLKTHTSQKPETIRRRRRSSARTGWAFSLATDLAYDVNVVLDLACGVIYTLTPDSVT